MIARRRAAQAVVIAVLAAGCSDATEPFLAPHVTSVSPDRGPLAGGTVVTITGLNFFDVSSVTVGGVELAEVTIANATRLTGVTPVGSQVGVQEIVVTGRSGSGRCSECYRYTQFPGLLQLQLVGAPDDSTRWPGGLWVRVSGPAPLSISSPPGGTAIPWTAAATSATHLIVKGSLRRGMLLATLAVPDTQEAVRTRYSAAVVQATYPAWNQYRQLSPADYLVNLAP